MDSLVSMTIHYEDSSVEVVLASGVVFQLSFDDITKLSTAVPKNPTPITGTVTSVPAKVLFTDGIRAALAAKVINYIEALKLTDLTAKGFANVNLTTQNPIKDEFPQYWDFLQKYRESMGDANLT